MFLSERRRRKEGRWNKKKTMCVYRAGKASGCFSLNYSMYGFVVSQRTGYMRDLKNRSHWKPCVSLKLQPRLQAWKADWILYVLLTSRWKQTSHIFVSSSGTTADRNKLHTHFSHTSIYRDVLLFSAVKLKKAAWKQHSSWRSGGDFMWGRNQGDQWDALSKM